MNMKRILIFILFSLTGCANFSYSPIDYHASWLSYEAYSNKEKISYSVPNTQLVQSLSEIEDSQNLYSFRYGHSPSHYGSVISLTISLFDKVPCQSKLNVNGLLWCYRSTIKSGRHMTAASIKIRNGKSFDIMAAGPSEISIGVLKKLVNKVVLNVSFEGGQL